MDDVPSRNLVLPPQLDYGGSRRLACAILLNAIFQAGRGDEEALAYLQSDDSREWADALELQHWPPTKKQMTGLMGMKTKLIGRGE